MTTRRAECSCGKLAITCEGDPIRVSLCHCTACQRRTGSPFGQQARWAADRVTIQGASTAFTRAGDSGGHATFHFCPSCGATVYFTVERMPGMIAVPVGAFADAAFPPPVISFYGARKHAWLPLPAAVEHVD